MRGAPIVRVVLLALAGFQALADAPDVAEADRLRAEGVDLFKKGEYTAAADKYAAAIRAYEAALGKEDPGCLGTAATLWRAVAWCRAQAKDMEGTNQAISDFYDAVFLQGGNADEEAEVGNCLGWSLRELAKTGSREGIEGLHARYVEVLRKVISDAAGKEGDLRPLIERIQVAIGDAACRRFEALYIAGDPEGGLAGYRKALAYWEERKDTQRADWTPMSAFYFLEEADVAEAATFFLVESLRAIAKHDLAQDEIRVLVNLRNYLGRGKTTEEASGRVRMVQAAIEACEKEGLYTRGTTEELFRGSLEALLELAGDWEAAEANGKALAAIGEREKDASLAARGALASARALLDGGEAEKALERAEACLARAAKVADTRRVGHGWLWKGKALSSLGRHAEADAALRKAIEALKSACDGPAVSEAEMAGLQNAKAAKDEKLSAEYDERVRDLVAAGGLAGASIGSMEAEELVRRVLALDHVADVMEVTREGNQLRFKNLFDGEVVDEEIQEGYRCVNVSGVLFRVRGAEIVADNIMDSRTAPGMEGEVAMYVGQVYHTGPDFDPHRLRLFVAEGSIVRVDNCVRLYRVTR